MITIFHSLFWFFLFPTAAFQRKQLERAGVLYMMISCDSCTFMACRKSMTPQQGDSYIPRAAE